MALSKIKTNSLSDDAVTAAKIATGTIVAADLAANSVDSSELVDGGVDLSHMSVNSIDSDQYVDGSIDLAHMSVNSIDSDQYVDGSIDLAHMSVNSIDSDQYVDGSIDTAHIANDQITAALIADNAIDSDMYVDGSIDLAHMSVNSIDSDQYVDGSIDTAHYAAGSVDTTALGADSVTAAKIADDVINSEHYAAASIDNEHLADDAVGVAELSATGTASSSTFLRGDNSWTAVSTPITALNNATANELVTVGATTTELDAESLLTFNAASDPPLLYMEGAMELRHSGDAPRNITFDANRGAAGDSLGDINFQWNNTTVAKIAARAGVDTTNKDDANLAFYVTASGGSIGQKMILSHGGVLGVGADPNSDLGVGLHIRTADSGADVHTDADELVIEGSGHSGMTILSGTSSDGYIYFGDSGDNDIGSIQYDHTNNYFRFVVNTNERMRLNDGGLRVGSGGLADTWLHIDGKDGTSGSLVMNANARINMSNASTRDVINFGETSGYVRGKITHTVSSGVTYNSSSDYRLKENVNYNFDAITRLKELKPARFNWIAVPDETVDGFLAHEVSSVVPEAVNGTKDAMADKLKVVLDKDGNYLRENVLEVNWEDGKLSGEFPSDSTWHATKEYPEHQQMDNARLVPLLTAALQELEARVTTLEG